MSKITKSQLDFLEPRKLEPTEEDWQLMAPLIPGAARETKSKDDFVVFEDSKGEVVVVMVNNCSCIGRGCIFCMQFKQIA